MSIDQDITNLPTPPSRSDSPSDFSDKADTFLAALPQLQAELNTYADEANTTQTAINTSENNAATSEQNAEDWAVDLTGLVLSTDYSAKAYAVSENLVPEGAAKEWAIKTNGTVDGTDFSAKKYAIDAESSASAAAATAGATAWSAGVTYNTNDAAIGSDGNTYRSLVDSNLGNDPVLGDGSNWLNLTGGADVTKATLTKTFAAGESASLTLSEPVETAPVVSVTKEVPQTGVTTNDWDVAADGANFTLHDTAYDTTLTPETSGFGDISGASYDSPSLGVGSQDGGPAGIAFNTDGTKMYIVGFNDDNAYQYSLSTAFDLSTASYDSVSFSVLSQDGDASGLAFNTDGTKMYIVGFETNSVYQYSLSTGFDLSTASYDSVSFSVASEDSSPMSVIFNNNGTKMYIVGLANASVYQYSLSTAFDLSTASYDSVSFSVASEETFPRGIAFNSNGNKMYVVGTDNDTVYQYSLSTAFDLSTASYESVSFNVVTEATTPFDITFNSDGTKMYIVGSGNDSVYQYSVPTSEALVLGTGSFASTDVGKRVVGNGGEAILTGTDGSYELQTAFNDDSTIAAGDWSMFALDVASADLGLTLSGISQVLSTFNIESASYDNVSFDVSGQNTNPSGIFFKDDGSKLYILDIGTKSVFEYDLSIPWDVSTANYSGISFDVSSEEEDPFGISFKPDGTKMVIVGTNNRIVREYSLSTPWDLSTASYNGNAFDPTAQDGTPIGLFIKPDGLKMYIIGNSADTVYEYDISSSWNVSTASYNGNALSLNAQDTTPRGIFFKYDGTKMYAVGRDTDKIYQYDLTTPWLLSTASYSGISFDVSSEDTIPRKIYLREDGEKLYLLGNSNDSVYQYSTLQTSKYLPTATNHTAVTSGSIGTEFWTDINSMAADDAANDGAVYYAVSTDDRTTWKIIDDTEGTERAIVRNNGGTWEVNDASDYGTETWVAASENDEFYALEEAVDVDTAQSVNGFIDPAEWSYTGNSFSISSQENSTIGTLFFKDNGSKMYVLGNGTTSVYEYNVSTAYDVTTASYSGVSFSVSNETGSPFGLFFKSDGTAMYVSDDTSSSIYQYSLSVAWDISSASYSSVSFSTSSQDSTPLGLFFKPDGTKMYVVGLNSTSVYEYDLSTAWDLSTSSYSGNSFNVSSQETGPFGIFLSPEGQKMYVVGTSTDTVYEYELSTAWDVSSSVYNNNSFDVSTQDGNNHGLFFKPDGSKMYTAGQDNLSIFEYSTGSLTSTNRMDAAQLNAVSDANHYTLGNDLDLAITFFMADGNTSSPTSDGVAVNYDANVLNQGAVLGTDYEFDKPANNTVRITALSDENFKVRVV